MANPKAPENKVAEPTQAEKEFADRVAALDAREAEMKAQDADLATREEASEAKDLELADKEIAIVAKAKKGAVRPRSAEVNAHKAVLTYGNTYVIGGRVFTKGEALPITAALKATLEEDAIDILTVGSGESAEAMVRCKFTFEDI